MSYSFHPEAEREFIEAVEYYETCRAGLGLEFAAETCNTIERIVAHPKAWLALDGEIRRALTARFPYGVLYAEHQGEIYILALMHLHRKPDYWRHRVT